MDARKRSERELIDLITESFTRGKDIVVGVGEDDCAVMDLGVNYLLLTTDMLHRKSDLPVRMTAHQIGWMTVAVSLSDIASMGGRPSSFLAAIGLPDDVELDFIRELGIGMEACACRYDVSIVGGDIDKHDELTLVGTAIGTVDKDKLVRRKGAKVGDLLCVTGTLGDATAGLRIVLEEIEAPEDVEERLLRSLFEPVPRVEEGIELSGFATSMTDISDSLAISAHELANAGGIGFKLYEDQIPILDEIKQVSEELRKLYLYGGGDYELLFTIDPQNLNSARSNVSFTVIGEAVAENIYLADTNEEVGFGGYLHF
ncbi:MAG: thiamine-phosphate kinase [Halobacteriota archaeon]|nr:thiamine-phosphate kinase [Halobacteriota archaeon]